MKSDIYSIKIGGPAGMGVKSVGLMLAKLAVRSGYYIYNHIEYPSLIRGGHNVMQINISTREVIAPSKTTDLLVAFDQQTIDKHLSELTKDSKVLFDSDGYFDTTKINQEVCLFPIPLSKIAQETGQNEQFINIVAIGICVALGNGSLETLKALIDEEFKDKGQEVVFGNKNAAEKGFEYVQNNLAKAITDKLKPSDLMTSPIPLMVINGNDAVALGAISAGLEFSAIYPMSPISNIMHTLAANQDRYGYVFKQAEDEISAINMSIGASFAGKRSLTATSGGGFCLMTEGLGLAGNTEAPLVIVEGMRSGPATGLPTWSEQGDLQFVLHAHQGDFPRIVLAPGDAKEAFDLTKQAFNLADKYQTPIVLLLDKNICDHEQSFQFLDTVGYEINRGKFSTELIPNYQRYKNEPDGISLRSTPGSGNFFVTNSDEHNEEGYSTQEISDRNMMMGKRMKKLETCVREDLPKPQIFGPEKADLTIVSWGSNKGSILEALRSFKNVNYVHLTWLSPFPTDELSKILSTSKMILDVECNFTGQLANLIREKTGIEIRNKLLHYDGRQIYPEDIIEKINFVLKGKHD